MADSQVQKPKFPPSPGQDCDEPEFINGVWQQNCRENRQLHRNTRKTHEKATPVQGAQHFRCIHLGEPTGELQECPTCTGKVQIRLMECAIHGKCTTNKELQDIKCCQTCPDRKYIAPSRIVVIDSNKILPNTTCFNPGLFEDAGRLYLVARARWAHSAIVIVPLGDDLQPIERSAHVLDIRHPLAKHGCEDPRAWWHQGRLNISFSGYVSHPQQSVHVMRARLDPSKRRVEELIVPTIEGLGEWSKNWQFYSHNDRLYSVFRIAPQHWIHWHHGEHMSHGFVKEWNPAWTWGEMRGGAPPVLVPECGEMWHFFHAVKERPTGKLYTVGCYSFSAEPPFEPRRLIQAPLIVPPDSERDGLDKAVAFVCGAVRRGDSWLLSLGWFDRECRIATFEHRDLDKLLQPV